MFIAVLEISISKGSGDQTIFLISNIKVANLDSSCKKAYFVQVPRPIFTRRLVSDIRRSLRGIRPAGAQKYCQGKSASPFVTKILFDMLDAHIAASAARRVCVYITRQIRIFVSHAHADCSHPYGKVQSRHTRKGERARLPLVEDCFKFVLCK